MNVRAITTICLVVAASLTLTAAALQAATTGWVRVKHPALSGGGSTVYLRDILAAAPGEPWLAVGYLVDGDGTRVPSAWTSGDGVRWTRASMAPTASSERRDGPYLVARRGAAAVALGERFEGELRPAAWYRSAPNVWTSLTSPTDPLVAYRGRIRALDAGPEEFVAVGEDRSSGQSSVTVFASTDGRSWEIRGAFEPPGGFLPFGVSVANGRIVIVGATTTNFTDGRIWVLEESGSWTGVQPGPLGLDGPGDEVVTSVEWSAARGFVAGGSVVRDGHEIPTLWRSPDGVAWTRLPDGTPPNDGRNAAILRIVAVDSGFLASGLSDAGPRLWRSGDGTSWTALPPPPTMSGDLPFVVGAQGGGKLIVVTINEFGSQLHRRDGSRWVRADTGSAFPQAKGASELVDVAAMGSRVIAIGQDSDERPLVMVSSGGGAWQRRAFSDRTARLLAIVAHRGTLWAAGWRLVHGRASLAVWTSRDGRRWQRQGGTALEPVGAFFDIAPSRRGFVAIALEPSKRGFVTTAWTLTRTGWRDEGVLGPGEPRAVCVGPHGVTAVATRGSGLQSRVVAWTRTQSGRWPREPELVASGGAAAAGCADAPAGTVIVGQGAGLSAALWHRARRGEPWRGLVLAQTNPASSIGDVVRDGPGFLATGSFGGRGQVDLAVWCSPDGVGWGWLGGLDPVFTEAGYQAGLGVVRAGSKIVAVGRHGAGGAGVWIGPVPPTGGEPGP